MSRYPNLINVVGQFPNDAFYVYELRDGSHTFYVGKGAGTRHVQHIREALKGCDCRKCQRIRFIWESGDRVEIHCVYVAPDENAAYRFEAERIATIGLNNLCNAKPGDTVSDMPGRTAPKSRGTFQIYLPADLLEQWDTTPRYERSATVAAALRQFWSVRSSVRSEAQEAVKKGRKGQKSA